MINPYASYQQNQIMESAPEDIMLQLVQGAFVRAKQAKELWLEGEKVRARERSLQCMHIVCYLDETLDRENGGEIVDELEALYAYMIRELSRASRENDMSLVAPVQDVLATLYEGWKDAVAEYKESKKAEAGQEKVAHVG
jgi:flagellar protein FliS